MTNALRLLSARLDSGMSVQASQRTGAVGRIGIARNINSRPDTNTQGLFNNIDLHGRETYDAETGELFLRDRCR